MTRIIFSLITLIGISILALGYYYKLNYIDYKLLYCIKNDKINSKSNFSFTPLLTDLPSEYKWAHYLDHDSSFQYTYEVIQNLDYSKNDYIICCQRAIKSIYWSPSKGDQYYKLFDKIVPVYVEFDTINKKEVNIYSVPKERIRYSQNMDFN